MKILVTGASGMVGANLCRRLVESGRHVRALVRRSVDHPMLVNLSIEPCTGNVLDGESLKLAMQGCEQVYHLAGVISFEARDRQRMFDVNVQGTKNVLKAAFDAGVQRVVVTSSTAAVGYTRLGKPPLNEDSPFLPRYHKIPYMASKHVAEAYALAFPGMDVVAVNPSTVYGAGDVYLNTGQLFKKFKQGKITFCPPGGTAVVGVRDCVEGHLLAMERGVPGERYILSSENDTFKTLFQSMAESLRVRAPRWKLPSWLGPIAYGGASLAEHLTSWNRLPTISRHFITIAFCQRFFDSTKAQRELNWIPKQSLQEMIGEATEFYEAQQLI